MTPQEQQLLEDFLQRLSAVQGAAKDPQADALIQRYLSAHPDALYLLVQRCLLQQHALDTAKAQIAQLQQAQQQGGASFLGGQQQGWAQPQQPMPPPMPQQAPAPTWRDRLFGGGAPQQPSAAPSFLASAATTAAGVAGGMFLFDGIENLLGGHHGGGLFGSGQQPEVIENITENNFYDDGNRGDNFNAGNNDFNSDFADDNFDDSSFDDSSWS
ncbi:DUF2076 family protein [Dyella sp.]|uniref:DUF2076 family protein n=1 Tax=Dyella sp. TaxID=1869338 RepID=UPI002ED054EA